jgi:hypothetical protein
VTVGVTESAYMAQRIEHLEALTEALQATISQIARGTPIEDIPPVQPERNRLWCCKGCGLRIGVYDEVTEQLRIRYKDLFMQFVCGEGGKVVAWCRYCGLENAVDYAPPAEPPKTGPR